MFWRAFFTDLKKRGLTGVRLVISDQHAGLVAALKRSFQGTAHQRCRVHFARNLEWRRPGQVALRTSTLSSPLRIDADGSDIAQSYTVATLHRKLQTLQQMPFLGPWPPSQDR